MGPAICEPELYDAIQTGKHHGVSSVRLTHDFLNPSLLYDPLPVDSD